MQNIPQNNIMPSGGQNIQNTLDQYEDIQNELFKNDIYDLDSVSKDDVNKIAMIEDIKKVDTKYGTRYILLVNFENNAKKMVWLSKSFLKQLVQEVGHVKNLLGARVTFKITSILVAGKMIDKVVPVILKNGGSNTQVIQ